jgi:hypothetical protein
MWWRRAIHFNQEEEEQQHHEGQEQGKRSKAWKETLFFLYRRNKKLYLKEEMSQKEL